MMAQRIVLARVPLWWGLAFLLSACVTVNIYFPAPAMKDAAEKIVQEVWGEKVPDAPAKEAPKPQSSLSPEHGINPWWVVGKLLDLVSAPAHAGADINVSTAAVRSLKGSLQQRAGELIPFLDAGALGIDARGDLVVRDESVLQMRDRARLRSLVQAENADRAALYREIAAANNQPQWEGQIRDVFVQQWHGQARSGWWVESGGSWRRK